MVVPMPEPSTPSFGNGPIPKISSGFSTMLIRFAIHNTRIASVASPAPRKIALMMNSSITAALPP